MQQANARLIIEGGPLAPGILRVLTDTDETKLDEIYVRLRDLTALVEFASEGANSDYFDERKAKLSLIRAIGHISTSLQDITAIAGGFVRKEAA